MAVQREETSRDHLPLVVLPKTPPSSKRPGAFALRESTSCPQDTPGWATGVSRAGLWGEEPGDHSNSLAPFPNGAERCRTTDGRLTLTPWK